MSEYEIEPIRGLPGMLPPGEHIVWQGSPDWLTLARTAFSTRLVTIYFVLLTGWALESAWARHGGYLGVEMTAGLGLVGVALLYALALAEARTTVYTLTNRRIVLRIGIAVPKCINLPLRMIGAVDLALHRDGTGDVSLTITGPAKLGVAALWPHARPWKVIAPQPTLRAIPDAHAVADQIARACRAVNPQGSAVVTPTPAGRAPAFAEAANA